MNRIIKYLMETCHISENKAYDVLLQVTNLQNINEGESIFKFHAASTKYEAKDLTDIEYYRIAQEYDNIINNDTGEQEIQAIQQVTDIDFNEIEGEV